MSFGYESGEALPNADVLRLREYAKIMSYVSDLTEALEQNQDKSDLENNVTIEIEKNPHVLIPTAITEQVGEVAYITAKLKLATDIVSKDEDITPNYETLPSDEMFFDLAYNDSLAMSEQTISRQASSVSLNFFGPNGMFILSRSNLTQPQDDVKDHVVRYSNSDSDPVPVEAVSAEDLNVFIVSAVNPAAVPSYSDKHIDITSPETFAALSALFSLSGRTETTDSTLYLPGQDNFFKHRQEYDPKTDQFKTSFQVRYESTEPTHHPIIATHTLDTNFQLSFETITNGGAFTPKALEDTPRREAYTPTLDELTHLTTILATEVRKLYAETEEVDDTFEVGEDIESADPDLEEIFNPIEMNHRFEKIAERDTRREFAAMADIAITQELEQILSDEPKDDDTEN